MLDLRIEIWNSPRPWIALMVKHSNLGSEPSTVHSIVWQSQNDAQDYAVSSKVARQECEKYEQANRYQVMSMLDIVNHDV